MIVLAELFEWLFGSLGLPLIVDLALLLILVAAGVAFGVGGFRLTRGAEQRWAAPPPFGEPVAVAVDGAGGIVVADRLENRVITLGVDAAFDAKPTRAGPAALATSDGHVLTADAKSASGDDDAEVPGCEELRYPMGLVVAPDGSLFVAETGRDRVVRINDGRVEAIAGGHGRGFGGDGDVASQARAGIATGARVRSGRSVVHRRSFESPDSSDWLRRPHHYRRRDGDAWGRRGRRASASSGPTLPIAVAVDSQGGLVIADEGNGLLRSVTQDGRIRTVAGVRGEPFGRPPLRYSPTVTS